MAIVLTSLQPTANPIQTVSGSTITFQANYYEDTNPTAFVISSAQWQVSTDFDEGTLTGNWQNIVGATNNQNLGDTNADGKADYTSVYTTGALNPGNSGNYYRIQLTSAGGEIFTSDTYEINGVPGAYGYRRILVTSNPQISIIDENLGDPVKVTSVGGTLPNVTAVATYTNREIDSSDDLTGLTIRWRVSYNYDPDNPTAATWNIITPPNIFNGTTDVGNASITETIFDLGNQNFVKQSTLSISDVQFGLNFAYVSAQYLSSGVNNSPLTTGAVFQILVNPEITIVTQPGVAASDTKSPAWCWSQGNSSNGVYSGETGGDVRISINATSSAGFLSPLTYQWEFKAFFDNQLIASGPVLAAGDTGSVDNFLPVDDANNNAFIIQSQDNLLRFKRLIYADRYVFRCIVSGEFETPVTSNEYTLYLRDNQTAANQITGSAGTALIKQSLEDYYGNVLGRELLTDKALRFLIFNGSINTAPYYGQSGSVLISWQRLNPGLTDINSNWVDIPDTDVYKNVSSVIQDATATNPGSTIVRLESEVRTPYLRINQSDNVTALDQGARYRLKIQSSSQYTGLNTTTGSRTYTTWYGTLGTDNQNVTLQLFREIFITTQPASVEVFATENVSFSVAADATSFPVGQTFTYQWQWARLTNGIPGTFNNLSNGNFFTTTGQTGPSTGNTVSGVSTSTLLISTVSDEIKNYAFRCIVNLTGAQSSVTSNYVTIAITEDRFSQITSINDLTLLEYQNAQWTVTATTLSLGTILYQWQKSTNNGTTWTNLTNGGRITGATTNSLTITGVLDPEDEGLYRLRLISRGGITAFSNVVSLIVNSVEIIVLQNLPSTRIFVEDENISPPFSITAVSTIGESVSYLWQYSRDGITYFDFGFGLDFQLDTENPFTPNPFFKTSNPSTSWDSSRVRCRLSIPSLGTNYAYSNVCTLDVRRRFYYFADTPTKVVETGSSLTIDLNPTFTGSDVPTYSWEYSSNNGSTWQTVNNLSPAPVNGSSVLFAASVPSSWNNYIFRCRVTLNLVDDFVYVRNNAQQIDVVNGFGYTAEVKINVVTQRILPVFYSKENGKTGAAIGTVICIPKPSGFVNDNDTSTVDDIDRWGCSLTGSVLSTDDSSSSITSGNVYTDNYNYLNRNISPAWITVSGFKSPKWKLRDDRFPGFIELRGQWLLVTEFPLLFEQIGKTYGYVGSLAGNQPGDKFKLPNPYGKRIMGTGAINSRLGRTSVIPIYNPDGTLGGDRTVPGTIGGVYLYEKSRQLPAGSPGISGQPDGTAGISDPSTFELGNYRTDGWEQAESLLTINYRGTMTYSVGPTSEAGSSTPHPHSHAGTAVGVFDSYLADTSCTRGSTPALNNGNFFDVSAGGGEVGAGPGSVPSTFRGRQHTHGISDSFVNAGTSYSSNMGAGKGDTPAPNRFTSNSINIHFERGSSSPTFNSLVEPTTAVMSVGSRTIFDASLSFYLRNNEQIPLISSYYRVKWLIKAY